MSGGAAVDFGATGEGAGVGIAGEIGAADGENAGVVTGSSALDAVLLDERECFVLDVAAEACRAVVGLTVAAAAGVVDGVGVAAAPAWIGCGVGTGDGTESVAAAAGAG